MSPEEIRKCKQLGDLEGEVWKDVVGYEGGYMVSSLGRVKSLDRLCYRKRLPPRLSNGIIIAICFDQDGYGLVNLRKEGVKLTKKVHRLVAESFIPNRESLPVVHHIDTNKMNNRVDNLEWVTIQKNVEYHFMGLDSTSDYNGVYLDQSGKNKVWVCSYRHEGRGREVGRYKDEEDARSARLYAEEFGYEAARGEYMNSRLKKLTSKYKGVSLNTKNKKPWIASGRNEGKSACIGFYKTEIEAYEARLYYEEFGYLKAKERYLASK